MSTESEQLINDPPACPRQCLRARRIVDELLRLGTSGQRAREVFLEIGGVLDPDREPDQARLEPGAQALRLAQGHLREVARAAGQTLDAAQAGGLGEEFEAADHAQGFGVGGAGRVGAQDEREQAAGVGQELAREEIRNLLYFLIDVVVQFGIEHRERCATHPRDLVVGSAPLLFVDADAQAVGLVGLIGIGSLTGRLVIGALADRLGRPLTLIVMQAALGASFLLWAAAAGGYPMLAAFAVCVGLSYGGIVSLLPALAMDLFGARAVASIIGTLYTGAAFGNLAGPWLAGWVFDRSGGYTLVIWGCVLLSAAATLTNWLAVRRRAGG